MGVQDISLWQLGSAYLFVLLSLGICAARGIPKYKDLVLAALRMTGQLALAGWVLRWVLREPQPWVTVLIFLGMEAFASFSVFRRVKGTLTPALKKAAAGSLFLGTTASLTYFILVVVQVHPWYAPQYGIPLGGMIIGNAMTAVSLAAGRLLNDTSLQRDQIEGALMLGARPQAIMKPIVDRTFDAALMPTLNSMLGMGIVFLPGLMTGQILSGSSPVTAIKYQIAIMLGILGSVSLSTILFLLWGSSSLFNRRAQFQDLGNK